MQRSSATVAFVMESVIVATMVTAAAAVVIAAAAVVIAAAAVVTATAVVMTTAAAVVVAAAAEVTAAAAVMTAAVVRLMMSVILIDPINRRDFLSTVGKEFRFPLKQIATRDIFGRLVQKRE